MIPQRSHHHGVVRAVCPLSWMELQTPVLAGCGKPASQRRVGTDAAAEYDRGDTRPLYGEHGRLHKRVSSTLLDPVREFR